MQRTTVLEADEVSDFAAENSSHTSLPAVEFPLAPDPSTYLLVDPPRRHTRFRSWFALAFFGGILIALGIVAILNS